MKKVITFLIVSVMLLSFVGCTTTSQAPMTPTISVTAPITTTEQNINQYYFNREDWVIQHKDSTDPTDIALIKYEQAIEAYTNGHPEVGLRSDWGVDYSGELTILTDLGVAGLSGKNQVSVDGRCIRVTVQPLILSAGQYPVCVQSLSPLHEHRVHCPATCTNI